MKRNRSLPVLGICLAAGTALADPSTQELQLQLEQLKARVADLQVRQEHLSDAAVAQTIESVLADADRRSQLLAAEGFTAGWDKGFWLKSADGNYAMKLGLLFQPRFVTDYRDGAKSNGDSDMQSGWEIKRTQFIVSGNAISPDLTYNFMWESPQSGGMTLLDAYITYKCTDAWGFKVGQYFDPLSRETLNGPPRRLGVESSLVDFYLAGGLSDRVQGVSALYGMYGKDNPIYAELMLHDGVKSRNTNFENGQGSGNFGVAGRVEAKCFGDWASYKDMTAAANKEDLLAFGAGFDFTEFDNLQQVLGSIDGQWETGKLACFAAVNLHWTDSRNTAGDGSAFDWGGLVQAAYLLSENWEVFGRYGYIDYDSQPAVGSDQIHEIVAGVNYYLAPATPHRAKVTVDLTYLPNGGGAGATGLGIIGGTDETEIVVRGQFQLWI